MSSASAWRASKKRAGVYITPRLPKLVYVLDEHNCPKGRRLYHPTRYAVSAKRMYQLHLHKKMKENYERANVFSPMGCRSISCPLERKRELPV